MIILVRHGEADHHVEDMTGGWTDSDLTPNGTNQMRKLAAHLGKFLNGKRVIVVASDLKRTKQSAAIISKRLSMPLIENGFLREKNNGIAANKTNTEAQLLKMRTQESDPDGRNYQGGESRREFYNRVTKGMDGLWQDYANQTLLIVAHKGTLQNIIFWWLGLSIDEVCRLSISFNVSAASMSILTVNRWEEHELSLLNYRVGYGKDN